MPIENMPPRLPDGWGGVALAIAAALMGRVLYRADAHRRGLRPFLSRDWLVELPTIVVMAVVGKGLAEALVSGGLIPAGGWAEAAVIVAGAYFGLRGFEAVLLAWIARINPRGPADPH
jgi:hypothetical protein